jgi:hypothetical protein
VGIPSIPFGLATFSPSFSVFLHFCFCHGSCSQEKVLKPVVMKEQQIQDSLFKGKQKAADEKVAHAKAEQKLKAEKRKSREAERDLKEHAYDG